MAKIQVNNINLFEFIIALVVVLLLTLSVASMNLSQKSVVDEVNFEMGKQNFEHTTSLIRAQWLLEGRPQLLTFNFYIDHNTISTKKTFQLSSQGWPLVNNNSKNTCEKLWLDINNLTAKDKIERYVHTTNIKKEGDNSCQFCDASQSDSCLNYSPRYGIDTTHITLTK